MGQPAARLGDLTAHGGVVTSGNPTVLVNGQPAATVGDLHVCPMCSPGPHVGGPVVVGAPTVLIGGRPAARVGDTCTCAAPAPDVIVQGSPNVLVGGASGATSLGAAAAAAAVHRASLVPGTPGTGTTARPLSPWVGVGYQDAAGRPVTGWHYRAEGERQREGQVGTGGQVWCDALAGSGAVDVGLVGVYGCQWDRDEARVGEAVGMSARCVGVVDGELALFEVWRETATADGSASRAKVWEVMGEVAGGRVEAAAPFVFAWPDDSAPESEAGTSAHRAYTEPGDDRPMRPIGTGATGPPGTSDALLPRPPQYRVEVVLGGAHRARGGLLRHQDWIEIEVVDAEGAPAPGATFQMIASTGEVREGRTGRDGVCRFETVPPGPHRVLNVRLA